MIQKESDYLVSIKTSRDISAKIFQYIATGKRIIHFSGNEEDPDVEYLKRYPKAHIVECYKDTIEVQINKFLEQSFEDVNYDERISFEKNYPSYSKQLISTIYLKGNTTSIQKD